ncbi:MAG: trypsin-like peptidase domain-containing protein [Actinomycetota bacterium]|nr:trypsin-like peptidase domain-containing protein [Actinomycetota bacterium]
MPMTSTDLHGASADAAGARRPRRVAAMLALAALSSGGLGAGLAAVLTTGAVHVGRGKAERTARLTASTATSTAAIAKAVEPAVVDVNTTLDPLEGGGAAAGTGMILSASGLIVTNNHVVQGADSIEVTIPGHGRHAATVVGTDPSQDVAVVRVSGLSDLPTVHFANSSTATLGTSVVAIGNALALGGSPTVTTGIISATGRTITASDSTGANTETLHGMLQTDAPIAPGDSGGPLVNASAEVVGMDTAAATAGTSSSNVGFAIPINRVHKIAQEIIGHKDLPGIVYGRQGFLGVEVVDSSQIGSGVNPYGPFGNPFGFGYGFGPVATTPNGTPGIVIAAVDPHSAADRAGLQSGDVIMAVNGQATPTTTALSKIMQAKKPGQAITLKVATANGTTTLHVTLGAGPVD